jgi:hypothetical protein
MYRPYLYISAILVVMLAASLANADGVCSGYPKMYNGKPCASTTRYFDGNMGACGCGTGDTSPFAWQWTKPTAAASAPIFGAGTWCGNGCGKCFKLTPTAIGASPEGTGAPDLTSLVVKVTNLCPYSGNENWCAYDVNSFGYEAHFDLMDYNMAGVVTSMGWNNPEVTYEEVDCAANGYVDWQCQCASGSSSTPATAATTTPIVATNAPAVDTPAVATQAPAVATEAPAVATEAPTVATEAPAVATQAPVVATQAPAATQSTVEGNVKIQVNGGSNTWWVGFSLSNPAVSAISFIEIQDAASTAWTRMTLQGDQYWNLYSANPTQAITLPLSLRFTGTNGNVVTATNIITAFQSATVDTGVAV